MSTATVADLALFLSSQKWSGRPPTPQNASSPSSSFLTCLSTGAAFTSNVIVPRKDFKVIKGHPKNWVAVGGSGKKNDHFFCGGSFPPIPSSYRPFPLVLSRPTNQTTDCGSSLYTELEVMPDAVVIKSGGIDDKQAKDFPVQVEFYTKDRLGYCAEQKGAKQVEVFG